jgi:hypothetical protein
MIRVDLKRELKHFNNPSVKEITIVDIPEMHYLMIDGAGDPNTAREYQDAIEVLYTVSYTLNFLVNKENTIDYSVMSLEGLR